MKDKILLTLLLSIVAIYCSGQSFLVKYPKLTDRNLGEFSRIGKFIRIAFLLVISLKTAYCLML